MRNVTCAQCVFFFVCLSYDTWCYTTIHDVSTTICLETIAKFMLLHIEFFIITTVLIIYSMPQYNDSIMINLYLLVVNI